VAGDQQGDHGPMCAPLRETPTIRSYTRLQDGLRMLHEDKCPLRLQTWSLYDKLLREAGKVPAAVLGDDDEVFDADAAYLTVVEAGLYGYHITGY